MNVLYVEDEPVLGRIVKQSLESRGCRMEWYTSADRAATALAHPDTFDIAVLDVQLPGRDGFSIGRQLRLAAPDLPILFLTARVDAADAVTGFRSGGDDYLRKPFSMEELLVRMENLVRLRAGSGDGSADTEEVYQLGGTTFAYRSLTLVDDRGRRIDLSHREAELLRYLILRSAQEVIPRPNILRDLWGDDGFFHSRNLDVYVRKLRKHLEGEPDVRILTLRGVGYRMLLHDDAT
ncbi:response regulator transcription factor [Lewinella sp. IMCC34183]|uniref:response regulator transcription factor n=1 Tax=Lewinella sp. IMCC34183 TaxID=2248762 RepID=UPI000E288FB4|nr:response regulator transcription factor [Lewinella sp. IMCC34183]